MFLSDIQAKITGPQELYIKKGSTISLTCIIELQDLPPSNVTWYHAGAVIDFDGPRYKQMSIKLRDTQLADRIIVQIVLIARIVYANTRSRTNSEIGNLIRVI